jgi:hypothetical protein
MNRSRSLSSRFGLLHFKRSVPACVQNAASCCMYNTTYIFFFFANQYNLHHGCWTGQLFCSDFSVVLRMQPPAAGDHPDRPAKRSWTILDSSLFFVQEKEKEKEKEKENDWLGYTYIYIFMQQDWTGQPLNWSASIQPGAYCTEIIRCCPLLIS